MYTHRTEKQNKNKMPNIPNVQKTTWDENSGVGIFIVASKPPALSMYDFCCITNWPRAILSLKKR